MQIVSVSPDLKDSAVQRQTMVDRQIRTFDVTDQRLIAQLLSVPRERFVPDSMRDFAYSDVGMTVEAGEGGENRYLLPAFILARMIQGAQVRASDRALDVAAGTGYSSAILAGLAADTVVLESSSERRKDIEARLASVGLGRIQVMDRDLRQGVAEAGPYDVILVNGAVETGLEPLFAQLSDGGRLVAIQRSALDPTGDAAKVLCFEKRNGHVGTRYLFDARAPILPDFQRPPAFSF
jgi:protein-L-isoaspartate(D-aspartate) O-methyltransferase